MTPKNNILIGIIIALLVIASYNVDANPIEFVEGLPNLVVVLEEMIQVEPKYIPTAIWAMFETIQMAFHRNCSGNCNCITSKYACCTKS